MKRIILVIFCSIIVFSAFSKSFTEYYFTFSVNSRKELDSISKIISIDNGIMHMIGLANIPMIVLFGPTNSEKFAPKIDKIDILDSKLIYNSNDILKIKVQDVLNLMK